MPETKHKRHTIRHAHHHGLLQATRIELVRSGDDYFIRALDIINGSKQKLYLQTYIFTDDSTGKTVIEALQNAVKRGVKIQVLVDAFGSFAMHKEAIQAMEKSGIEFRKFSPLFVNHGIRFGRRLHHKILIADENEALIGGINIEDKYHIKKSENTPWLDYAVYITGPVCHYIDYICENTWKGKFYGAKMRKHYNHNYENGKGITVRIRQNDWVQKKEGISRSLRSSLLHAHESITIIGSYFLPGTRIRKLLRQASKRGVKIKLVLQGTSDVTLVQKASTWWYAWLLRNKIEIYEWNKTVLHGKMILIDNKWASVGSYNINHLSDYASIETNVDVYNHEFCNIVKEEMQRVMDLSQHVTTSEYHHKMNPLQQFSCWASFHIVRFLFGLQFILLAKE